MILVYEIGNSIRVESLAATVNAMRKEVLSVNAGFVGLRGLFSIGNCFIQY